MLKKMFYVFSLLAVCSCSNQVEDIDGVSRAENAIPEAKAEFVRLVDNTTRDAGTLTFEAQGAEATLEWIVEEGLNLDTMQTVVALSGGKGELPIRWSKKLEDGTYGPRDYAFKAGVIVTSENDSQYFPLVWAYQVDTAKIAAQTVQTRSGQSIPRASTIRFVPQTVKMNDEVGATMMVTYTGTNFVLLDYSDFTQEMNIKMDDLPQVVGIDGSTYKALEFRWGKGDMNNVLPFSADVLAVDDIGGIAARGTVTWGASTPTLSILPDKQSIPATGGTNIASATITTNQYRWTAVTNQNWLRIAPTTGNGHDVIFFSTDANPYPAERRALVEVVAYNTANVAVVRRTVEITQVGADPTTLTVTPIVHTVPTAGATVYSNITSNASWTAVSNASWLTVNLATGTGNGVIGFTATRNATQFSRTATVVITAGSITQTVLITQEATTKSSFKGIVTNCTNIRVTGGGRFIHSEIAVYGEYTAITAKFANTTIAGSKFVKHSDGTVTMTAGTYKVKFTGSFYHAGAANVYVASARDLFFRNGGNTDSVAALISGSVDVYTGRNATFSEVILTIPITTTIRCDAQIVGRNVPWGWTTGTYTVTSIEITEV